MVTSLKKTVMLAQQQFTLFVGQIEQYILTFDALTKCNVTISKKVSSQYFSIKFENTEEEDIYFANIQVAAADFETNVAVTWSGCDTVSLDYAEKILNFNTAVIGLCNYIKNKNVKQVHIVPEVKMELTVKPIEETKEEQEEELTSTIKIEPDPIIVAPKKANVHRIFNLSKNNIEDSEVRNKIATSIANNCMVVFGERHDYSLFYSNGKCKMNVPGKAVMFDNTEAAIDLFIAFYLKSKKDDK